MKTVKTVTSAGIQQEFFTDGVLAAQGPLRDGKRHGRWTNYYRSGGRRASGHFVDGKMDGAWEWWREDGQLLQTGSFHMDVQTGLWRRYRPDGQVADEREFREGKKVGVPKPDRVRKPKAEAVRDLGQIFAALKELLEPYRPPLTAPVETDRRFDLVSVKDLVIEGRKRKEVFFASLIIQKDYVGFYFMPVYSAPEMKALFQPELLALLKGKSCFHIRALDDGLRGQIRAALKDGFALYRSRGWV